MQGQLSSRYLRTTTLSALTLQRDHSTSRNITTPRSACPRGCDESVHGLGVWRLCFKMTCGILASLTNN